MVENKNVRGSADHAVPLTITETTVYIRTNIHPVVVASDDGTTLDMFEYDEIQYSRMEYADIQISNLQSSLISAKNEIDTLNIAMAAIMGGAI